MITPPALYMCKIQYNLTIVLLYILTGIVNYSAYFYKEKICPLKDAFTVPQDIV